MALMLDKLHEEMKSIYVSNEKAKLPVKQKEDEWQETAKLGQKICYNSLDHLNYPCSIVSDIFGGVLRKEFHVEGTRQTTVKHEPCFVLSLDIPFDGCTIEDCMDDFFSKVNNIEGY